MASRHWIAVRRKGWKVSGSNAPSGSPVPAPLPRPRPAPLPIPANDNYPLPANDNRPRLPSTRAGPARASVGRLLGALARRLVPGIAAVELAILFWEWRRNFNYHPQGVAFRNVPPTDPAYMPLGYRFETSTNLYGPYPAPPLTSAQWNTVLAGNPYAFTNGAPYSPPLTFWANGTSGLAPQSATINPAWVYVVKGPRPTPSDMYGAEIWIKDPAGQGSLERGAIDIVEWYPPSWSWPLDPLALPSIAPMTAPFEVPLGQPVLPVPQRLIRPLHRMPPGDLIERETGPEPARRIRPKWPRPRPWPREWPLDRPRQRPDPRPTQGPWKPPLQWDITERGVVSTPHKFEPAPDSTRELKLRTRYAQVFKKGMNIFTESNDAISAVHKAMPKRCRKSRTWRGADGKWHRARTDAMLRDIKNCAGDINVIKALANVVFNQIQDRAVGMSNRALNDRTGGVFGRSVSGQGLGTGLSHAQAGSDGHWSTGITDVGDWFGRSVPGVTLNQILRGTGISYRAPTGPPERRRRRKPTASH